MKHDGHTALDLDVQINNLDCTIKIYDKRDDFDFDIVNFPHLDSDIPQVHRMELTCLSWLDLQEYAAGLKISMKEIISCPANF